MAFLVKAIIPPRMNPNAYRIEIVKELDNQAQIMRRMFKKTVQTWSTPRPVFKVTAAIKGPPGPRGGVASQQAIASVETDSDIYRFVDQGTKVRWAVMGSGFSPKTSRRTIGSRRGRGGAVIAGRRAMQKRKIKPRPGIKARQFTQEIQKRRRSPFFKAMREAHRRGIRRAQRGE